MNEWDKLLEDAIDLLSQVGTWPSSVLQPPLPWQAARDGWIHRARNIGHPPDAPDRPSAFDTIFDGIQQAMKDGERIDMTLEDGQITIKVLR